MAVPKKDPPCPRAAPLLQITNNRVQWRPTMAACALLGSPNTTARFFSRLGQEREERERLGWVLCEGAFGYKKLACHNCSRCNGICPCQSKPDIFSCIHSCHRRCFMYVEIQFFWDSVGSFPYMNVPVPTFSVFSVKASGFVQTQSLTNWYRNMHCTLTCVQYCT